MEARNIILVWELYVHMASIFINIWLNVIWGLKFTFAQSFIWNTDLVYTQDSWSGFCENYLLLSLQITATLSYTTAQIVCELQTFVLLPSLH